MVNEIETISKDIIKKIDNLPKVICPIAHYFSPGIYLREMRIPKGTIAVGHCHKTEHFSFLMTGVAVFLGESSKPDMLTGPCFFLSNPGHKIVFAATDIVVQNIHPNPDNITDQDKLEEMFIDKTGYFDTLSNSNGHHKDILDFETLDNKYKVLPKEQIIDLPRGFKTVLSVRKSSIHGKGIFSSAPFAKGDYICPYRMFSRLTIFAKFVNHSKNPNAILQAVGDGEIVAFAKEDIAGCTGDSKGTEITLDYRESESCLGEQ
jgi:hypothetical protein